MRFHGFLEIPDAKQIIPIIRLAQVCQTRHPTPIITMDISMLIEPAFISQFLGHRFIQLFGLLVVRAWKESMQSHRVFHATELPVT